MDVVVAACSASNDSTMALTVVSAGDAPGAVLLLLLRLRVSLRLRCSMLLMLRMLLEALSSRSVSGAAGDMLLPSASRPLSSSGKKSLASMDSGVNVCSARVTNGKGEDEEAGEATVVAVASVASDMGESGDATDSRG